LLIDPSQLCGGFIIIIFEREYDQLKRTLHQILVEPLARFIRLASGTRHEISRRQTPLSAGAPEEIRTPDPQIRSLVLYPAELRARFSLSIWA
jgi:hypothetical protein